VKKDDPLLNTASKNDGRFPDRYAAPYTEGKMSQMWYRPSNIRANPPKGLKKSTSDTLSRPKCHKHRTLLHVSSWKGR